MFDRPKIKLMEGNKNSRLLLFGENQSNAAKSQRLNALAFFMIIRPFLLLFWKASCIYFCYVF